MRGSSITKLHGFSRWSSCGIKIFSTPVRTPLVEPGSRNTYVWPHSAASARLWIVDVAMSWYDSQRNSSPNPGIGLVTSGASASGVTSRGVTPVPPVAIPTSTPGSAIHCASCARITISESLTIARAAMRCPTSRRRSAISWPDLSSASVRVSEMVRTATLTGMNSRPMPAAYRVMTRAMRIEGLGELTRHEDVEEWLVSDEVAVPYFGGIRLRFIFDCIGDDPRPEEFGAAAARFLALTTADRDRAAPAGLECYGEFCKIVGRPPIKIKTAAKVWEHVEPIEIFVGRAGSLETPVFVRIAAETAWDEEHGIEITYKNGLILDEIRSE